MVEWIHAEVDRYGDQLLRLRQFIFTVSSPLSLSLSLSLSPAGLLYLLASYLVCTVYNSVLKVFPHENLQPCLFSFYQSVNYLWCSFRVVLSTVRPRPCPEGREKCDTPSQRRADRCQGRQDPEQVREFSGEQREKRERESERERERRQGDLNPFPFQAQRSAVHSRTIFVYENRTRRRHVFEAERVPGSEVDFEETGSMRSKKIHDI